MHPKNTIYGRPTAKSHGITAEQSRLLERFDLKDHVYAFRLALEGALTEEHLQKPPYDNWENAVLRFAANN